jgi:L-ribulose-5-phosphate 4-epimerase
MALAVATPILFTTDVNANIRALQQEALEANLALVRAGLVILTFGNASVLDRDQGVFAIKPSGVPYDELRAASMVLVDVETGAVVAGEHRPSSDTPTHAHLYRRFEGIGAVAHTHSRYATAWAQSGRDLPCLGTTHADHFHGAVPVTRLLSPEQVASAYEEETGAVIAETFEERELDPLETPAALVVSHGPFVWGTDGTHAVETAIALEAVAEIALLTLALQPLVEPLAEHVLERHFTRKHGPAAYYGQL